MQNGAVMEGFFRVATDPEWTHASLERVGEGDDFTAPDIVIIKADSDEEAKAKLEQVLFSRFPSPDPRLTTWRPSSAYNPTYTRGLFLEEGQSLSTAFKLAKKYGSIKTQIPCNHESFEPIVKDGVAAICEHDGWGNSNVYVSCEDEVVAQAKRRQKYMKSSSPIRSWMTDIRRCAMYHMGSRIRTWIKQNGGPRKVMLSHWGRNNLDQAKTFLGLMEGVRRLYGETLQQVMSDAADDFWRDYQSRCFKELELRKKNSMLLVAKTARKFFKTKEERHWAALVSWYFRRRRYRAYEKAPPALS